MGKDEEGTIEISCYIEKNFLYIVVKDDGKGLDVDKIRAKAVKNKLISPEAALNMSDEEATKLIFETGFSTNDKTTDLSGRGVGMDVVKKSIEENLNGTIQLETKLNFGLKVTLKIPCVNEVEEEIRSELLYI